MAPTRIVEGPNLSTSDRDVRPEVESPSKDGVLFPPTEPRVFLAGTPRVRSKYHARRDCPAIAHRGDVGHREMRR
eukprot:1324943-Lingulodinium_polyedra.AAC.1